MVSRFTAPGTHNTVGSGAKTIISIVQPAAAVTRPIVRGIVLGFNGTPADNAFLSDLVRCSAVGAGTSTAAVTPTPHDPGDIASNLIAGEGYTAEPTTVGVTLEEFPQHQRTTIAFQWAEEDGYVLTGTASNKILLRTLHASYTGAVSGSIIYRE